MLLIADSGSTKSDWMLKQNGKEIIFNTVGINPFFHDKEFICNAIKSNETLYNLRKEVSELYFYGAGCSSPEFNAKVESSLALVFDNAKIIVEHDLTACAFATYDGEPGISCILGTGSNSCFYDGELIIEKVPALGYILGDEGSGSYFGKKLITNYLYNRLPLSLKNDFEKEYRLTKEQIFENIYQKPNANVYLASFMSFIVYHRESSYIKEIIIEGFREFISTHVKCYDNYLQCKIHFIGSIAYLFENELKQVLSEEDLKLGMMIRKPIDGLYNYHLKLSEQTTLNLNKDYGRAHKQL